MRKSEERIKIESLNTGDKIKFPKCQYVKICRVVSVANITARAKGLVKPEDILYQIDGHTEPDKVIVTRAL